MAARSLHISAQIFRNATVFHLAPPTTSALALMNSNSVAPGATSSAWQNHGTCSVQLFQHRTSLKIRALATHAHSDRILLNQLVSARANLVPIRCPLPQSSSAAAAAALGSGALALTGTRTAESYASAAADDAAGVISSFAWRNQDCADASATSPAELTCAVSFRNPDGAFVRSRIR